MAGLSDTSPEADQVLTEAYRRMSPGQKWLQLGRMYQDARALHAAGVRLRSPDAGPREVQEAWLRFNLGFTQMGCVGGPAPEQDMPNLRDLRDVLRVFNDLGIVYALGGSMASSVHGIDRYTRDADVTAEPFPGREAQLVGAFGPDYYVSEPAVRQAIRARSSFNIINTSTGLKVDVFIRKDEPFEQSAMARRLTLEFPDAPDQPIVLDTAEDVVLHKLRGYRLGKASSEQQISDVVGVLKAQAGRLDLAYLDRWAAHLGLTDLLARARREADL
jgi:hypothetical protein